MLMLAALGNHAAITRQLLEAGADPAVTDKKGRSMLHYAAHSDAVEVIELIMDTPVGAELMVKGDVAGALPIHCAAASGCNEAIKIFLDAGCAPDAADKYGRTPLYNAAGSGHLPTMELLLDHGSQVGLPTNSATGRSPLLKTISNGYLECAQRLLKAGADLHDRDTEGRTILHYAVLEGHLDAVREVLSGQLGVFSATYDLNEVVDVNAQDAKGRTPLHIACVHSYDEMYACVRGWVVCWFVGWFVCFCFCFFNGFFASLAGLVGWC